MAEKELEDIELRSDEVKDILTEAPAWIIRWGITFIFTLIVGLLVFSYVVRYPDKVTGQAKVTTVQEPLVMVTPASGHVARIAGVEGMEVKAGDTLLEIHNPMSLADAKQLERLVSGLKEHEKLSRFELPDLDTLLFGDVQHQVSTLMQTLKAYQDFERNTFDKQEVRMLKKKIKHFKELISIGRQQIKLKNRELASAKEQYQTDKTFYEEGVISKMDFLQKENLYLQQKQALEEQKKSRVQQKITLLDFESSLEQKVQARKDARRSYLRDLEAQIQALESGLANWKQRYLVVAQGDGKLVKSGPLDMGQFVTQGNPLFTILPDQDSLIVRGVLPVVGVGKVQVGQRVLIRLDHFPSAEYGQLEGRVFSLSEVPGEEGYQVDIQLVNGLVSTYGKALTYKPGMSGILEIITEDRRLLDRLLDDFRSLMDK